MKAKIVFLAFTVVATSILFTACQKNSTNEETNIETEASTHSDDENFFSAESDAAVNDADGLLETTAGFTARGNQIQSIICDASVVVDTMANPRTITPT